VRPFTRGLIKGTIENKVNGFLLKSNYAILEIIRDGGVEKEFSKNSNVYNKYPYYKKVALKATFLLILHDIIKVYREDIVFITFL